MINRSKNISLILLLAMVLCYQFVQLANVHYHVLNDGSIVKHSHFYNKSKTDQTSKPVNHTHTTRELILLAGFSSLFDDEVGEQVQLSVNEQDAFICNCPIPNKFISQSITFYGLRGPPQNL